MSSTLKSIALAALAGSTLLGLSACSEVPQVTVYEQGQYRGKADTRPLNSPPSQGRVSDLPW